MNLLEKKITCFLPYSSTENVTGAVNQFKACKEIERIFIVHPDSPDVVLPDGCQGLPARLLQQTRTWKKIAAHINTPFTCDIATQSGNLNRQFPLLNRHFQILNRHFQILSRHFTNLNRHFTILKRHFPILKRQFLSLNRHFPILSRHFQNLNRHFLNLNRHFLNLNRHFSILNRQFPNLIRQSSMIN